ncbi:YihY/virulence factor BrkB family protein [Plastorhodobacter daqingensis]|uniref:YihY/virulence factor BrkB family protein n=1 Tax=Plastorhodobacter daqingensis TaxID=1387281 RepID=A0ABW2UM45_9RHOB
MRRGVIGPAMVAALAALLVLLTVRGPERAHRAPPGTRLRAGRAPMAEGGRGRTAAGPLQIPLAGWKDILWRSYGQLGQDRVMLVAAGVTFYGLLALFPALTALISVYGLFADAGTVVRHVGMMEGLLPDSAIEILSGQMERIAAQPTGQLGFGFVMGLGITLWSANNGMKAIFDAMNVAYNEVEGRSFLRLTAVSLFFTLCAMALVVVIIGVVVLLPVALRFVGLDGLGELALRVGRWPVLLLALIGAICVIYRFAPDRERPDWRWVWPGALVAAVVWVAASIGFSWYVTSFDSYNETYGSLGAVIAFMVWMWVSATIVIMGAELNAEMERQTRRDSTTGAPLPMGQRGAQAADTLGQSRS